MKESDEEILQRAYEAKLGSLYAKAGRIPVQYDEIVQDVDAVIAPLDAGITPTISEIEQSLRSKSSSKQLRTAVTKDLDFSDWSSRSIL